MWKTAARCGSAVCLAALAVSLGVLAGCGGGGSSGNASAGHAKAAASSVPDSEVLPIRLGIIASIPVYWSYYGAEALGYIKEENLKPTVTSAGDEDCIRGMLGGSLDACPTGLDSVIRAAQKGADIRVIGTVADPTVNALNVNPDKVKTWSDLKGKKVATDTPISASSVAIRALLAKHGLSPDDLTFLTVGGSSDRYAALQGGKVDAAITSQPQQFIGADQGFPVIGTSLDAKPIINVLAAIPGRSEKTDAALTRLLAAMEKADAWLSDPSHKDKAIQLMAKIFQIEPKYAQQTYQLLVEKAHYVQNGVKISMDSIARVSKLTNDYTPTKVTAKPQDLVDEDYVKAALGG